MTPPGERCIAAVGAMRRIAAIDSTRCIAAMGSTPTTTAALVVMTRVSTPAERRPSLTRAPLG